MLLINRLTAPGGIRRLELYPETVRVVTADGGDVLYRLDNTHNAATLNLSSERTRVNEEGGSNGRHGR